MTNQEINEAVAKRLGWKFKTDDVSGNHWHKDGYCYDDIPDYCSNIAAAFEIVEKNPKYFSVSWDDDAEKWNAGWFEIEALADTAPMAICLAFLKLEDKRRTLATLYSRIKPTIQSKDIYTWKVKKPYRKGSISRRRL